MWQAYLWLAAGLLGTVALALFAHTYRKRGEDAVKKQIAERAAQNADRIADIAVNDSAADVNQRLRDGKF